MSKRLVDYIEKVHRGSAGCLKEYESSLNKQDDPWPWLAGHYRAMLQDLLDILPPRFIDWIVIYTEWEDEQ